MEGEDADELERLDEAIAELDDEDSEEAVLRAAELLFDKALLVEAAAGDDAALRWYVEGAQRLWRAEVSDGTAEELVEMLAWCIERIANRIPGVPEALGQVAGEPFDEERPLTLLDDLRRRHARPEVPGLLHIEALLDMLAARTLNELLYEEAALEHYGRVIRALAGEDAAHLRALAADAMVLRAEVLDDLGRAGEAAALMRSIVERFDPDESEDVAESIEAAQEWLAAEPGRRLLEQGRQLMSRIGRGAEAEAAFRAALAAGNADGSLLLGWLLVDLPGRRAEGEAALRDALDPRNQPYTVAAAAFRLGGLAYLRRDHDEARRLLTLAAEQGVGDYSPNAHGLLGVLAACDGDRVTAEREFRVQVIAEFARRDVEPDGFDVRIARLHATLNDVRATRRMLRGYRVVREVIARRRRALRWSSSPACAIGRRLR